jgi:hypothetical protein
MTENIIILLLFTLVVIALFILSACQLLLFLRIKNERPDAPTAAETGEELTEAQKKALADAEKFSSGLAAILDYDGTKREGTK